MATLNKPRRSTAPRTHEGGRAKKIDAVAQLRRSVMSCLLWEDQFYEDGVSIAERIKQGVADVDLKTASEIAIEAREVMHLRHVPLLITREMARRGGGSDAHLIGDTLARVILRADELAEFVAIYWMDGKEPLSAQVKRGLAEAFTKFDEYQIAKYDRAKDVRLRDVLFLTHPEPKDDDQQAMWDRLVNGTLATPDTWETNLSSGGDKKEHWTRLLDEKRLGGLALLRNLRNMEQADVDRAKIREAISGHPFHRVLPFRFIAAAQHAPTFEPELEKAMFRAASTLEKIKGRTALVIDTSGSMTASLSGRSTMSRIDAATGLAVLVREISDDIDVIAFGTEAAKVPPRRGFALVDAIKGVDVGWSTHMEKGHKLAKTGGYDRVVIITDEQAHDNLSDPMDGATGVVINTASYQNGVGYGRWMHIDGWSEGVLRYMKEMGL